tara:strand:- start:1532 stop:3901 length:2370 start_codon:yes stop_codon:yes gene_type:complete
MDYSQTKLTKKEWEALEVPIDAKEKEILTLISKGYNDVEYTYNKSKSLLEFMKLSNESKLIEKFHNYLYITYFKTKVDNLIKVYDFKIKIKVETHKIGLKKADIFRINNTNSKLSDNNSFIYEFILLEECTKFLKSKKIKYYYTMSQLIKNHIYLLNTHVKEFINEILIQYENSVNKLDLIKNAHKYIERNGVLSKYDDVKLYEHQKELFSTCKQKQSKLILYQAPTGTGKTMSPIGLAQNHKLIFVCAAKHVGLQLARACISMHIPIGIAFGCRDAGDVRLHYFAAKEYTKNYKSGGIFHVDHSVGDKVQVIISDVTSYLPAMYYLSAFTEDIDDIIMYWDEPTISLDYKSHKLHPTLQEIWKENVIPNVVLSSATLPNENEIANTILNFKNRFDNCIIKSIVSYECKKTIPIINLNGYYVLPHNLYENYEQLEKCIEHCKQTKTILRYMDLEDICRFIYFINKNYELTDSIQVNNYFKNVGNITIVSIKLYYLELFAEVKDSWSEIYKIINENKKATYSSNIYVTTKDSHTLTDGPTLFLANDIQKIAKFCFQSAKIPKNELENILSNIKHNDRLKGYIAKLQKQLSNKEDERKEDSTKTRIKQTPGDELRKKISSLQQQYKNIELEKKFIPNTRSHMYKYNNGTIVPNAFTSDIDDKIVEQIMMLDVEDLWKVLLIMGIGVFTNEHNNITYMEIMKKLAYNQQLYLIIASTDYIYGTNYQFCHEYISKDLSNMSQEKIIQAFGRIGRSNVNQDYSIRLRDDSLIHKIFEKEENKIEVENMNRLFST